MLFDLLNRELLQTFEIVVRETFPSASALQERKDKPHVAMRLPFPVDLDDRAGQHACTSWQVRLRKTFQSFCLRSVGQGLFYLVLITRLLNTQDAHLASVTPGACMKQRQPQTARLRVFLGTAGSLQFVCLLVA